MEKKYNPKDLIQEPNYNLYTKPTKRVERLQKKEIQEAEQPERKRKRQYFTLDQILENGLTSSSDIFQYSRKRMVKEQLVARGIKDKNVLLAMEKVPRHLFVTEALHATAYDDRPLPIAAGQTISQPYVVALMCQLLLTEPNMKVLEVGTGSGYQAAVLHEMGLQVYSVERIQELFLNTSKLLKEKLAYCKMHLALSDGTLGYPAHAPYDRIIVAAGGPQIPLALKEQLAEGGVMLIPVGREQHKQHLVRVFKINGQFKEEDFGVVSFVDLVGKYGW